MIGESRDENIAGGGVGAEWVRVEGDGAYASGYKS